MYHLYNIVCFVYTKCAHNLAGNFPHINELALYSKYKFAIGMHCVQHISQHCGKDGIHFAFVVLRSNYGANLPYLILQGERGYALNICLLTHCNLTQIFIQQEPERNLYAIVSRGTCIRMIVYVCRYCC